jgi:hypothetical protein
MKVSWSDKEAEGLMRFIPAYEYRHPQVFSRVRVGVGVWLLFITVLLLGYDRGVWWALVLIPAAALCFYVAYRLPRAIMSARAKSEKPAS